MDEVVAVQGRPKGIVAKVLAALGDAAGAWQTAIWVSRQYDTARALLAYGDRLGAADITVIGEPERLDQGQGYRCVQQAASAAGITIVEG